MTNDEKKEILAIMEGAIDLYGEKLLDLLYNLSDELKDDPKLTSENKELLEQIIQTANQKDLRIN